MVIRSFPICQICDGFTGIVDVEMFGIHIGNHFALASCLQVGSLFVDVFKCRDDPRTHDFAEVFDCRADVLFDVLFPVYAVEAFHHGILYEGG